jgi:hypothetical protein
LAPEDFLKRDCIARACHPAQLGDAGSVWKGKSHHFSSRHTPTPTFISPLTQATNIRIYYPGRKGLALGRHSEKATPTPTASQDDRSLLQQPAVPAPCRNPISLRMGQGQTIYKPGGEAGSLLPHTHTHTPSPPPCLVFLDLTARPGSVQPIEASDHSLAGTEPLQNRQRHTAFLAPSPQKCRG